jgi:hypothetical protein
VGSTPTGGTSPNVWYFGLLLALAIVPHPGNAQAASTS